MMQLLAWSAKSSQRARGCYLKCWTKWHFTKRKRCSNWKQQPLWRLKTTGIACLFSVAAVKESPQTGWLKGRKSCSHNTGGKKFEQSSRQHGPASSRRSRGDPSPGFLQLLVVLGIPRFATASLRSLPSCLHLPLGDVNQSYGFKYHDSNFYLQITPFSWDPQCI